MKIQIVYEEGETTNENKIARVKQIRTSLGIGLFDANQLMEGTSIPLLDLELIGKLQKADKI